jgi:hypothetical protein
MFSENAATIVPSFPDVALLGGEVIISMSRYHSLASHRVALAITLCL